MIMASQNRVFNMAKRLAKDHSITIATIVTNSSEEKLSRENLNSVSIKFQPIYSLNYNKNKIQKKLLGARWLLSYILFGMSSREYYWNNKKIIKQLENLINSNDFDIVQVEMWYSGSIFQKISQETIKVIDTHDVLYEKKERECEIAHGARMPLFKRKELNNYKKTEIDVTKSADIIISLSQHDYKKFRVIAPNSKNILVPTGQDIDYFKSYSKYSANKDSTILFYGCCGDKQNIDAFFRLYYKILPKIKLDIPEVKLIVLGSNPPKIMESLNSRTNIEITDFVEDVRPYIAKAKIMILPMETAGGFRSRAVEVMAMGVPILGTHNALDSIGFTNWIEGVLEDDNSSLAKSAVELLKNDSKLQRMALAAKKFVERKYNIETTYGQLSKFYSDL